MFDFKGPDLHSYALKKRQIREDFDKLKTTENEKEINDTLEKYEFYIEENYSVNPLFCKSVFNPFR
jgi:hypothetical protein